MIGNKIANKITSEGKSKNKEKNETNGKEEIYIPPESRQQIIDDLKLFRHHIKIEYREIVNFLDTTSDKVRRFITKKRIEVVDQSGTRRKRYKPSKQKRFKASTLRSDLCDYSDAYIVVKGKITVSTIDGVNNIRDKK